jgi:hypothetical protein
MAEKNEKKGFASFRDLAKARGQAPAPQEAKPQPGWKFVSDVGRSVDDIGEAQARSRIARRPYADQDS